MCASFNHLCKVRCHVVSTNLPQTDEVGQGPLYPDQDTCHSIGIQYPSDRVGRFVSKKNTGFSTTFW